VEIAPGKLREALLIDRPLTLKGAGDLTRLVGFGRGSLIVVDADPTLPVRLEALSLEAGEADFGGGILVLRGRVEIVNVRITRSRATSGGALAIKGGEVEASLLRVEHTEAEKGGGIWIGAGAGLDLLEAQISSTRASMGGAIAIEAGGRLWLEAVTIKKSRATRRDGGQVMHVGGGVDQAEVSLSHVRFADPPLGKPLVHAGEGLIAVGGCDLPRTVLTEPGVADRGENNWR